MKELQTLLVFFFLCPMVLWAQPQVPDRPSANVGNYSKYAEIEPNLTNGALSVPIPITTVSEGPLSIPISLSYHTAGIRAHELASEVGLGWTLNAGGAVTRQVRGLADNKSHGFFQTYHKVKDGNISNDDYDDYLNRELDGESDIYTYNINGSAGRFVMDENQNCYAIPNKDLEIKYNTPTGAPESFTIRTTDGTLYTFTGRYETTDFGTQSFTSAYFLSNVKSSDGLHSISFNYITDNYSYYSLQDCQKYNSTNCEMHIATVEVSTPRISSIVTSTSSITFEYENRDDLLGGMRLDKIDVKEAGLTKTYDLAHSYFNDNSFNSTPSDISGSFSSSVVKKRLKLDRIDISGADGNTANNVSVPSYEFDYYGLNSAANGTFFPSHITMAIDHWGFYNGETGNNLKRNTHTDNSSRVSDFQSMIAGALRQIKYPLGGTTTYEYDANRYYTSFSNWSLNNGQTRTEYVDVNDIHTGVIHIEMEGVSCIFQEPYRLIIRNSTTNTIVYERRGLATSSVVNAMIPLSHITDLQPYQSYDFSFEVLAGCTATSASMSYSAVNGNSTAVCGGLRLKKVTSTDKVGMSPDIVREFKYSAYNTIQAGILYRIPRYSYGSIKSSNSITQLASFDGYHIGYPMVEVDYNGNGSKKIMFGVKPTQNDFGTFPPKPEQFRSGQFGQLVSTTTYSESGTELQYSMNTYIDNLDMSVSNVMYALAVVDGRKYHSTYTVKSGTILPQKIENRFQDITTIESLDYNLAQNLLPTTRTLHDDQGYELRKVEYSYTDHYADLNSAETVALRNYFNARNTIMPYRTVVTLNGNGLKTTNRVDYDFFSGHARPAENLTIYEETGKPTITDKTILNSYDSHGMLESLTAPGALQNTTFDYYNYSHQLKSKCVGNLCTSYQYRNTNSRLLSKITDVDLTTKEFTYDGLMRLKTSEDCTGATVEHTYELAEAYPRIIQRASYPSDPNNLSDLSDLITYRYMDGLGRSIGTVGMQQAANGQDQQTTITYDQQGRKEYVYEPFATGGTIGDFSSAYTSQPRTRFTYEASPLNRPDRTYPPEWNGRKIVDYSYSKQSSLTDPWNISHADLFKKTVFDGDGDFTNTFTDRRGNLILHQRGSTDGTMNNTWYNYDSADRLIEVVPPGSNANKDELNFHYQYDAEGKVTMKTIPSKGNIEYVYDPRDLVIGQRDPHLLDEGKWYKYIYDTYARETHSGLHNSRPLSSQADLLPNIPFSRTSYSASNNSSKGKISQSAAKLLSSNTWMTTNNFYDPCGRLDYTTSNNVLNSGTYDRTDMYYDGASNIVRIKENARLGAATADERTVNFRTEIDDDGRTYRERFQLAGLNDRTLCQLAYDNKDLLSTKYQGGTNSSYLQKTDYDYLENQRLKQVNSGNATGTDLFGYTINYWQNTGNVSGFTTPSIQAQYDGNINSFIWVEAGMATEYNNYRYDYLDRLTHSYTRNDQWNTSYTYDHRGNFDQVSRIENGVMVDDLDYNYDSGNSNRLQSITESMDKTVGYKKVNNSQYIYDENGNIIHDPQKGIDIVYNQLDLPENIVFDDGRQIAFIYDGGGRLWQKKLFLSGQSQALQTHSYIGSYELIDDRLYRIMHSEGALINKGLEEHLEYLYLNHQQMDDEEFQAKVVESTGQIMQNSTNYKASDCILLNSGFEVKQNGSTEFSANIIPPPTYQESWRYDWNIHDYVGNLRMVYTGTSRNSLTVLQSQSYHPYGMAHSKTLKTNLENNYQFNGIDFVGDFGLDWSMATYRSLDAAVGMWGQVDPKAEYLYGHTPYNSMLNNPISFNDPDGDLVWFVPVIAGAVGGLGNLAYNASKGNINSFGDGLKAFGIGAAAGVGATFAAVPAATALAGATGVTLSGGFVTGAFVGGVGAGIEEIARNAGNAAVFKDVTWGEALGNIGMGIVTGAAVGGVYQGLKDVYGFDPFSGDFKFKPTGDNFWNGQSVAPGRNPFALNNTPKGSEWGPSTFYSEQNSLKSFSTDYSRDITGSSRGKEFVKNYEVWDRSAAEAWESMTNTPFRMNQTHYLEGGSRMRVYMAKNWKYGPSLIHQNSNGDILWKIRFWR